MQKAVGAHVYPGPERAKKWEAQPIVQVRQRYSDCDAIVRILDGRVDRCDKHQLRSGRRDVYKWQSRRPAWLGAVDRIVTKGAGTTDVGPGRALGQSDDGNNNPER